MMRTCRFFDKVAEATHPHHDGTPHAIDWALGMTDAGERCADVEPPLSARGWALCIPFWHVVKVMQSPLEVACLGSCPLTQVS